MIRFLPLAGDALQSSHAAPHRPTAPPYPIATKLPKKIAAWLIPNIAFPTLAMASAPHGGHQPSASDLIIPWIAFIIFTTSIFLILRKPYLTFWALRRDRIMKAVKDAEIRLEQAEKELAKAKERERDLEKALEGVRTLIAAELTAEREEILQTAKAQATRIVEDAKERIESERRRLEENMIADISAKIVDRARALVLSKLSPQVEQKLQDRALQHAPLLQENIGPR